MKTRNATPTINGFLFQINVAIFLMIKYIAEMDNIRVEGYKEDIEIKLKNSKKIMVQAKSQYADLENKSNVLSKLKSALESLNEADGTDVDKLIYLSNLPDPLNNNDIEFTTYHGITTKKYTELISTSREVIDKHLENLFASEWEKFDRNKLWIMRIPFYGEDDDEKHKFIYEMVKEFLYSINDRLLYKNFVKHWESIFLNNGASDPLLVISKKDLANYLILTCLESYDATKDYETLHIDQSEYDEAYYKYSNFIEDQLDCYEITSKIYVLYHRAKKNKSFTISEFVETHRIVLYNLLFHKNIKNIAEIKSEDYLDLIVSQIIAYVALLKKEVIKRVEDKVIK